MSEEDGKTQSDGLAPFWRRIKEHRIAQWTVGYIALAYGIQHAVILTSESFEWPNIVARISMLLLILGLPLVMTLAWYHGERTSRRISGGELAIIAVLLVIGSFLFYVFVRPVEQIAARPAVVAQTPAQTQIGAAAPALAKPAANSVAVLPFLNLSGDPKEEFFSDGMTEEITSALTKIPNLDVVGRTSAFQFKGKAGDLRAIGKALNASYVLEGSVRKDGNQVRITAQLIKAETGDHLWSDSYDRELKGIFAVQEDVAKAIAAALQIPLGLSQGESLVSNRDIDPKSYQDYLRAKELFRSRGAPIALLEQVVSRQPNYAPAWALLAKVYASAPSSDPGFAMGLEDQLHRLAEVDLPMAEAAAHRALQLDPRNADAYAALGSMQRHHNKMLDADQSFKQALSLDPLNPDALDYYAHLLAQTGRIKEAVVVREQLLALDPLPAVYKANAATVFEAAGENTRALATLEALPLGSNARTQIVAMIYAGMKKYPEAADALLTAPRQNYPPGVVETAARLLRTAPTPATAGNIPYLGDLSWAFVYVGLPERALDYWEHIVDAGYTFSRSEAFWSSEYAPVRKTERFKSLVRKAGLVDYWRAKGWPEWCHPTTGDDFACH